jgi:outer membrane protein W
MSKTILFLTFLGIAHLLPAQNRPFQLALNIGLPLPIFATPDRSIHLSINPNWLLTEKTRIEGEIAYSYMHYSPNISFFNHKAGQTFQWDALVGFRYYLVGVSHHIKPYIIRPYITVSAGYSYVKDEEFRDPILRIEHNNRFQLVGSVNLEIKKHFLLTFSAQGNGFLMVTRMGYQF